MSKLNPRRAAPRPAPTGPIGVASTTPDTFTYEGAPAHTRDAKSELFLLAVVNMVGEDTFYESAGDRDSRFASLVRELALADPVWLYNMLVWLREDANMRSAPIVGAAEMVKARIEAGADELILGTDQRGINRVVIDAVLQRPDEPAELLGYWLDRYAPARQDRKRKGLTLPIALRRGISDAVYRLYNERAVLKYDSKDRAVRMGDVVDLVRPTTHLPGVRGTWRGDLYEHLLDRRHGREKPLREWLTVLRGRQELFAMPEDQRRAFLRTAGAVERLRAAGVTWEALAGWLPGGMDAEAWEMVIPTMGYMAKIRNLRNFDQAGVSDAIADQVAAQLSDPEQVARSRQFPYRFLSAYMAVSSDRWREPLRRALQHSVANVPALDGRTLVLVDTSASMAHMTLSARSKVSPVLAGALFGVALAVKGQGVDLYGFADGNPFRHPVLRGSSVLRETEQFAARIGDDGHGTNIPGSVRATFQGHDRIVIVTDMQTFGGSSYWRGDVADAAPREVPIYAFNMAGYTPTLMDGSPNRHELGGLTDATFRVMALLERGKDAPWPWENSEG